MWFTNNGSTIGRITAGVPNFGGLAPLTPVRILDTRTGIGASGLVRAGKPYSLSVLGQGGVPASGVAAVVLNVTVTQPAAASYLTVYPNGTSRPATSNLNFNPGQTVANLVIAPVGADGKIDFYNADGSTQIVADVSGWFPAGAPAPGDWRRRPRFVSWTPAPVSGPADWCGPVNR